MKLTQANLATLKNVQTPNYDRDAVRSGIVHLGVGAFHRGHQAAFIDDILADEPTWGIVGASLRSASTADALNPQDGLYSLMVKEGKSTHIRLMGSLSRVLVAPVEREALLETMADPQIKIVSLTITEKGYCYDAAQDRLNKSHPDIVKDLASPLEPISAPGLIVEALRRRMESGAGPFTVLSCDNLPSNGRVVQKIIIEFAHLLDAELAAWIEENVTCPASMVDRIVPATTDADRAFLKSTTDIEDQWPIVTEPFRQWVIEDNFCAGRPAFESVGVEMVADVTPFEHMKLRMLNGSHSFLAYAGLLKGHEFVAEAIADDELRTHVLNMMTDEIMPTLDLPDSFDLYAYRDELIERFENPGMAHRLTQIAMDGSQKLPQRLLNTIRDCMATNQPYSYLIKAVAAWIKFVSQSGEGQPFGPLNDPMRQALEQDVRTANGKLQHLAEQVLARQEIFGADLSQSDAFRNALLKKIKA
ncbi:mannitol dehydrogenase family protein [Maritalea sp. S77]|uniref:mannitol dehydrogenase family protein n=1 Tax=Maritalea sp. S77 TaxID=3415125 RepID=UPI003C7C2381